MTEFFTPEIAVTLFVVVTAVALRTGMGLAKRGWKTANGSVVIFSSIIAIFLGIQMILPQINTSVEPNDLLLQMVTSILAIYGSTALFDKAKAIADGKNVAKMGGSGVGTV